MAVYKRTYRAYNGPLTPAPWRFLVLQRYAFRSLFRSRFLLVGYLACFILPLLALCLLYVNQNTSLLAQINQKPGFLKINGSWFYNFFQIQGALAGLLTAFVGPSLIAPDLTNGALGLYLSRPFSRAEYVLGKSAVLGTLIASITLLPALVLFLVQCSLSPLSWFRDNIFIVGGSFVICALMTSLFILLGLSMSAWVRWRIVAGALVLGVYGGSKGFAAVVNTVMRTDAGSYFDFQYLLGDVGRALLQNQTPVEPIPAVNATLALCVFCGLLLVLLNRKLRVCEVAG